MKRGMILLDDGSYISVSADSIERSETHFSLWDGDSITATVKIDKAQAVYITESKEKNA